MLLAGDTALQTLLRNGGTWLSRTGWQSWLIKMTIIYRTPLYLMLQRVFYDGHLKLFGAQLHPVGCAVVYKTERLRKCFSYAEPRVGDNLSTSEGIYIGHFFSWKGYRNFQVAGVRCDGALSNPAPTAIVFMVERISAVPALLQGSSAFALSICQEFCAPPSDLWKPRSWRKSPTR